jgi:ferredoxin-NADP reductase
MKLQLAEVKNRKSDIKEFVFKSEQPLNWQAGQYMHYVLPHENADDRGIERWFTISAAPSEHEVRITTRINDERGSTFKKALQAMKPGDEIEADGPEGNFVLGDQSRNYIFIAGGIGITPIRSILVEAADKRLQPHVTLLYANRNDEVTFREELESLKTENPNLTTRYIISPERLDSTILKSTLETVENPVVYISGPEPMVKDMKSQLQELGVSEENLKTDDFPGYEGI